MCVCARARTRACVCLAAGALDWQDKRGRCCLMLAASRGLTCVVRSLLAAGANAGLIDALNYTSLMLACKHSHAEAAEVLIEATKLSGSIHCKALRSGATARTWATYNRLAGVISKLDDAGAAATAGVDANSLPFPCSAPVESFNVPSDESLAEDTVLLNITAAVGEGNVTRLPTDPQSLRSDMHDETTSFDFSLPTLEERQFVYSYCKKLAGEDRAARADRHFSVGATAWHNVVQTKYFALNLSLERESAVMTFKKVLQQLATLSRMTYDMKQCEQCEEEQSKAGKGGAHNNPPKMQWLVVGRLHDISYEINRGLEQMSNVKGFQESFKKVAQQLVTLQAIVCTSKQCEQCEEKQRKAGKGEAHINPPTMQSLVVCRLQDMIEESKRGLQQMSNLKGSCINCGKTKGEI